MFKLKDEHDNKTRKEGEIFWVEVDDNVTVRLHCPKFDTRIQTL